MTGSPAAFVQRHGRVEEGLAPPPPVFRLPRPAGSIKRRHHRRWDNWRNANNPYSHIRPFGEFVYGDYVYGRYLIRKPFDGVV